jgi:hypothetical protein
MGLIAYFMYILAHAKLMTFVSSPIPKPPSAASLILLLPFIEDVIVMIGPSILEDLYSLGPEAVRKVVEGTRFIVFGGTPLNVITGNALAAAGMKLSAGWGT